MKTTPLILCILDGYGLAEPSAHNAVTQANTPYLDSLFQDFPYSKIQTHGEAVGLPAGQMGNSEVGHMTIGAGRVLKQTLPRINEEITSGVFQKNEILQKAIKQAKQRSSSIHLLGLIGPGGVHSHEDHMVALIHECATANIPTAVHAFTDGRDTGTQNGVKHIQIIQEAISAHPHTSLVTISGRYFAMDRDKRWERTKKAMDVITQPVRNNNYCSQRSTQYIESQYNQNITDEFIEPTCLDENYPGIQPNDVIISVNFRTDRMRQTVSKLKERFPENRLYTMTHYSNEIAVDGVFYPPQPITDTLSEVLAQNNISQLHVAETEKYPHVTFFLNGQREEHYAAEEWAIIPSPKVASYDLEPNMSAEQVADVVLKSLQSQKHEVIIVNFANPDMVGHTGDQSAVEQALEFLDTKVKAIATEVLKQDGVLLVTADHGNAECMQNSDGTPMTYHTKNLVPFIPVSKRDISVKLVGTLADIAPTMLELLTITPPKSMTGRSLIDPE